MLRSLACGIQGVRGVDLEQLVDRIYEAALFPDNWRGVLHDIDVLVTGAGTTVMTWRADAWVGWRDSPAIEGHRELFTGSAAATESRTTAKLLAANRAGFVADHEVMEEQEYLDDSVMTQFGSVIGLHRSAATAISIPGGDSAIVHVWRAAGQPKFGPDSLALLDTLRPHLARAAMLSARLRLEQMRAQVQALEALGIPGGVLDTSGRLVAANNLLQAMSTHFVWLAGDHLALKDKNASAILREEFARASSNRQHPGRSFVARGGSVEDEAIIIHLVPLRGYGRELFDGAWRLLAVNRPGAAAPDTSLLQGLFDLTAGEARIAAGLLDGLSVAELSRRDGVSVLTVRTQVRSVLNKSGVTRQSEFIARLRGVTRAPQERS